MELLGHINNEDDKISDDLGAFNMLNKTFYMLWLNKFSINRNIN